MAANARRQSHFFDESRKAAYSPPVWLAIPVSDQPTPNPSRPAGKGDMGPGG